MKNIIHSSRVACYKNTLEMKSLNKLMLFFIILFGIQCISFSQTIPWSIYIEGSRKETLIDMAVGDTNVYILGKFTSDSMKIKNTWYKNKSIFGYSDVFITKIDRNGNVVWYKQLASSKDDDASALVVSKNEAFIYFNITINDSVTIDTFHLSKGEYLLRYSNQGKLEWAKMLNKFDYVGCSGYRTNNSFADDAGNYYNLGKAVKSYFCSAFIDINNDTLFSRRFCYYSSESYLSSINKDGNKKNQPIYLLSNNHYSNGRWKKDKNNSSYLFGHFNKYIYDTDFPDCGFYTVDGYSFNNFDTLKSNNLNSYLIKLDSSNHFKWAKFSDGPYYTSMDNISFDANENVYCHGSYTGITVLEGITLGNDANSYGYFLMKYDKNGNFKWLRSDVYGEVSLVDNNSNFIFIPNFGTIKKYDATTGSFISDMSNVINLGGDIKMNRYGEVFGSMNYTGGTGNCDLAYATKFNGQTFCIPPFGNDNILLYKINGLGTNVTAVKNNKTTDIDVAIYPNPTTDKVKIRTGNEILSKVVILNNLGQIISESEINTTNFDVNLSTFPKGMYTFTLFSKDGFSISKRILKN